MPTIDQIYRDNLRELVREAGSQDALSARIGKSPAQISQWLNASKDSKTGKPRALSRTIARQIERKMDKTEGWMDQAHGASEPPAAYTAEPAKRKGEVFQALSTEEKELLGHFRHLLGKDRRAKLAEIAALAKERIEEREELFAEAGIPAIVERAAHASRQRSARASVDAGDRLKQRALPFDRRKGE